jgi:hypothetical protein
MTEKSLQSRSEMSAGVELVLMTRSRYDYESLFERLDGIDDAITEDEFISFIRRQTKTGQEDTLPVPRLQAVFRMISRGDGDIDLKDFEDFLREQAYVPLEARVDGRSLAKIGARMQEGALRTKSFLRARAEAADTAMGLWIGSEEPCLRNLPPCSELWKMG